MKKFFEALLHQFNLFVGTVHPSAQEQKETSTELINTIELALHKQSAVHVIYGEKSFTGDIVTFDRERQRLVMKNFTNNIGSIIRLADIKRIKLVPNTVRTSQKL